METTETFLERIYQEALCIELQLRGIAFERERPVLVHYRDVPIPGQRIDLIVETCILVELKAASRLAAAHHGQVISYLRTTGLRLGLLLNFSCPTLKDGIRRFNRPRPFVSLCKRVLGAFVAKPSSCPS